MDFNFILPLQLQTLVKIADTLWDSQSMGTLVENCNCNMYKVVDYIIEEDEKDVERIDFDVEEVVDEEMCNVLIGKISNLFLPEPIKDQLVWIARHVGLQKIAYYLYHEYLWDIKVFPKVYYWTSRGSIDKKKTAQSVIKDDMNDICLRFSLACIFCFEEDIRELSEKIPLSFQRSLSYSENKLSIFWYKTIKNGRKRKHNQMIEAENEEDSRLWVVRDTDIKTYKEAFVYSVRTCNSVSAEYFWGKLTSTEYSLEERQQDTYDYFSVMLLRYHQRHDNDDVDDYKDLTPKEYILDASLFLLNKMTKVQQMKALSVNPHLTLELFLDWPLQRMFFEAAEILCPLAIARKLSFLLDRILLKINDKYNTFDYREFFTRFWRFLPISQKSDIIDYCTWCSSVLFSCLFQVEYLDGIFLIVSDATESQKRNFLHSVYGLRVCNVLISRKEWELLKTFIDTCLPPTVPNLKFKKDVLKRFLSEGNVNDVYKILDITESVGS